MLLSEYLIRYTFSVITLTAIGSWALGVFVGIFITDVWIL